MKPPDVPIRRPKYGDGSWVMTAMLEVLSGRDAGHEMWLHDGERIEVGRTEMAEFVIADDPWMSGRHFALEIAGVQCRVRDLNSRNGTFVNGNKVTETLLRDGDEIGAGRTRFVLRLQSEAGGPVESGADLPATPADSAPHGEGPARLPEMDARPRSTPPARSNRDAVTTAELPIDMPSTPRREGLPVCESEGAGETLERVVIEIRSGSSAGHRFWLHPGQVLRVGRTEEADFVIADDPYLSRVHFALECGDTVCRILDCESRGGTYVNGQRIVEALLRPGDEIIAGQTSFLVQIVGGKNLSAAECIRTTWEEAHQPPATASGIAATGQLSFVEQACFSGLTSFRGSGAPADPVAVAERLVQAFPLFVIIDFNRLELPVPSELAAPDGAVGDLECPAVAGASGREHSKPAAACLFDWLPSEILAETSPVLLRADESAECLSLLKQGWGKDGLVCVYARQSKAALLNHLRSVVRCNNSDSGASEGDSVLAYYRPSIMAMLLANGSSGFVDNLLSGIEAVLLEADPPESWQIFGRNELADTLTQLGFVRDTDPAQAINKADLASP